MLPKRIFWLTCAAIVSWLIWMRLRRHHDEFATTIPQFAPPRTFAPPIPAVPPAPQPQPNKESATPLAVAPPATDTTPVVADSTNRAAAAPEAETADAPEADDLAEVEISGYCMRCKTKRPIQNAHRETTESGRPAARGTCPICGANMFTFLATDDDT